jgi:hypothetical protein
MPVESFRSIEEMNAAPIRATRRTHSTVSYVTVSVTSRFTLGSRGVAFSDLGVSRKPKPPEGESPKPCERLTAWIDASPGDRRRRTINDLPDVAHFAQPEPEVGQANYHRG